MSDPPQTFSFLPALKSTLSRFRSGGLRLAGVIVSLCAPEAVASAKPIQLTYWNWAPHIEQVVAIWNRNNPDIQVTVSRAAGALQIVPKLLAADRAGDPPDLTNVTYQDLPALIVNGLILDVTADLAPLRDQISPVAHNLVTFGETSWAVPQGTSPMMFYYRADLFERHGLVAPQTWADFARLARQVRAIDRRWYLTTFPTAEPGLFAALTHQRGASWWDLDNDVWTLGIAGESSRQVAAFWQDLVSNDLVATSQYWSPEWSAAMAEGRLLGFISAVWAPPLINAIAPDTRTKWRATRLPRWDDSPGSYASGVMGGSATAVSAKSKHPEAARKFALWLNNDPESLEAYVRLINIWPANLAARRLPILQQAPAFLPGQPDFYALATAIDEETPKVTWGPNVSTTFDTFRNAFAQAIRRRRSFVDALETVQRTSLRDLRAQGYEVREEPR